MPLIIYTSKEDTWLEKVKEYASFNGWSLSKAIRQILKVFVEVNMQDRAKTTAVIEIDQSTKNNSVTDLFDTNLKKVTQERLEDFNKAGEAFTEPELPKIDLATFEAQIMSKVNTPIGLEACIKDKTNDKGEISCYFFDNAREHQPYCKQYCWVRTDIWHERARP